MWKYKVAAFLHDTPFRAYFQARVCQESKYNEKFIKKLFKTVYNEDVPEDVLNNINIAKRCASGADRLINVKKEVNKLYFKHHVTGEKVPESSGIEIDPGDCNAIEKATNMLENVLTKIINEAKDEKETFIFIWRYLPHIVVAIGKKCGLKGYEHLPIIPENLFIPDHAFWDHTEITSAFFTALYNSNDFSIVIVKIPGPQRLILSSKKYRDLWGGSYLVSLTMAYILKSIAEEFGPDVVILPSIRENPLFDYFFIFHNEARSNLFEDLNNKLHKDLGDIDLLGLSRDYSRKYSRYSLLPNIAVLVLPSRYNGKEINEVIEELCENALKELIEELAQGAESVVKELKDTYIEILEDNAENYKEVVKKQLFNRLKPRISSIDASKIGSVDRLKEIVKGTYLEEELEQILRAINRINDNSTNIEVLASAFHILEIIARIKLENEVQEYEKLDAKKNLCDVCGERVRVFEIKYKSSEKERIEYLCGVCFVKRYLDKILINAQLWENAHKFVSHVDISFMKALESLEEMLQLTLSEEVFSEGEVTCLKVESSGRVLPKRPKRRFESRLRDLEKDVLRVLLEDKGEEEIEREIAERKTPKHIRRFFEDLKKCIYEISEVYPYIYDAEDLIDYLTAEGKPKRDIPVFNIQNCRVSEELKELMQKLKKLIKTLQKYKSIFREIFGTTPDDILESMKYFAIIKADGDSFGALLSRRIVKGNGRASYPPLRIYVHDDALSEIGDLTSALSVTTPSYVKAMSSSLTNYTLWLLSKLEGIKEDENKEFGKYYSIIYLGGDDIFIVSDPSNALEIASLVVSGFVKRYDYMPLFDDVNVVKLLPGWSMSVSVLWSHYKHPLRDAVRISHENLEESKKTRWEEPLDLFVINIDGKKKIQLLPSTSKASTSLNIIVSSGAGKNIIVRSFSRNVPKGFYYLPLRACYLIKTLNLLPQTSVSRFIYSLIDITNAIRRDAGLASQLNYADVFEKIMKKELRDHIFAVGKESKEKAESEGITVEMGSGGLVSIMDQTFCNNYLIPTEREKRFLHEYVSEAFSVIDEKIYYGLPKEISERMSNVNRFLNFALLLKLLYEVSRYYVVIGGAPYDLIIS